MSLVRSQETNKYIKSIIFNQLYKDSNQKSKLKIMIQITLINIKCLGIYLTEDLKDLYAKIRKKMITEIKGT